MYFCCRPYFLLPFAVESVCLRRTCTRHRRRYKERLKGSVEISRASMYVLLARRSWRAWLTLANEDTSLIRLDLMRTLDAKVWGGGGDIHTVGRARYWSCQVLSSQSRRRTSRNSTANAATDFDALGPPMLAGKVRSLRG